jgi:hypothetical protein
MASYLDCKKPMLKKIVLFIITSICVAQLQAQSNSYDDAPASDTVFRKNDEQVDAPSIEDNNELETKDYTSTFAEDVLGDTTVYFRDLIISPDSLKSWKENKRYSWIHNIDSLLKDKQQKEDEQAQNAMRKGRDLSDGLSGFERFLNSGFLRLLLWIIGGSVVAFIIYRLFLSQGIFGTTGKKAKNIVEEQEEIDNNMESDFESLQRKAYAASDLRVAMRYMFLKTLQKLNDRELIRFAADKTNSAYARELPQAKRNEFSSLALYYEYIWYGNIAVQKETFDGIENKFNEFLKRV